MLRRIENFVCNNPRCFDRNLSTGHLTASAWVLDENRAHALLLHHGKLNIWVQPGGHVENDTDMLSAAWREAREESGLHEIRPVSNCIFDVDVHEIPARRKEPAHFHYDLRFLFTADRNAKLILTAESKSLAWIPIERISEITQHESVLRMVRKTVRS